MRSPWSSILLAAAVALATFLPANAAAELVDQRGSAFALDAATRREPVVLTFIATRCTDACPIANAVFMTALAKAKKARVQASFVTMTLDPGYDTPFVISEYANRLGADARLWRFVSGPRADVLAVMHRFGVRGDAHDHSSFVYIVTPRGVHTLFLSNDAPSRIVEFLKKA